SDTGRGPAQPAAKGRRYRADQAQVLASPWFAQVGEASGIAVEFKLAAAQADGVVLDLRPMPRIRDRAHVTAFLVLTRGRWFDPALPMFDVSPDSPRRAKSVLARG